MTAQLPYIWHTVAPLNKDRARAAMEAACRNTSDVLRLCPPCIPNVIAVTVMDVALHTKDPDGLRDVLNIFLLPDLSPSARSEEALMTRNWDAILGTLNSSADTSLLVRKQEAALISG